MQNDELKELLAKQGHFMAIGVAVLVIVGTYFMAHDAKVEKSLKKIRGDRDKIKSISSRKPELPPEIDSVLALVKGNWEKEFVLTAAPGQEALYPPGQYDFDYEIAPADRWISPPVGLELTIGRESIEVAWEIPEGEPGKNMATIGGYHLIKTWKDGGKNQQKVIVINDEDETSHQDTEVETRLDYSYKIRTFATNVQAKGGKTVDFRGRKIVVSEFTEEKTGQILPQFKIKLLGVANDRSTGKKTAILRLEKWEKGDWRQTSCQIKEGDPIKAEEYNKDLKAKVSFNPGWTLTQVAPKVKKKEPYEKTVRIVKADGSVEVKKVKETRLIMTSGIRYKDDKGKTVTLFSR